MSAIDDVAQAVAKSDRLDAGTKAILGGFLQSAGPALANVATETLNDLLNRIAGGDSGGAVELLSETLSPQEIVGLLDATQQQMQSLTEKRSTSVTAAKTIIDALEAAAIQLVAQTIIAAI